MTENFYSLQQHFFVMSKNWDALLKLHSPPPHIEIYQRINVQLFYTNFVISQVAHDAEWVWHPRFRQSRACYPGNHCILTEAMLFFLNLTIIGCNVIENTPTYIFLWLITAPYSTIRVVSEFSSDCYVVPYWSYKDSSVIWWAYHRTIKCAFATRYNQLIGERKSWSDLKLYGVTFIWLFVLQWTLNWIYIKLCTLVLALLILKSDLFHVSN